MAIPQVALVNGRFASHKLPGLANLGHLFIADRDVTIAYCKLSIMSHIACVPLSSVNDYFIAQYKQA